MLVQEIHRKLYGTLPSEEQVAFYASGSRGFDLSGYDEVKFRATFALAISEAFRGPVIITVPSTLERKVVQELQVTSRRVFRRWRGHPAPVKALTNAIKKMSLASRFLQDEPKCWVSIGFTKEDPIPEWLRSRLWKKN